MMGTKLCKVCGEEVLMITPPRVDICSQNCLKVVENLAQSKAEFVPTSTEGYNGAEERKRTLGRRGGW